MQEKNLVNTSPVSTKTLTMTNAPIVSHEVNNDKIKLLESPPITPSSNRTSASINSKSSRFHSPEASKRIPATTLTKTNEITPYKMSNQAVNTRSKNDNHTPSIPTLPSVINLKNNDKYPVTNDTTQSSSHSSTVFSKLKNLLNKVGNQKPEETLNSTATATPDLLCAKNRAFNLCLGSSIPHENSDFDFNRKCQSKARQQEQELEKNTENDQIIIPFKSPKYTASPPKPKPISLFSEIGKELANIERNSILESLNTGHKSNYPARAVNQQKPSNQNEIIYQLDDDSIYFKETTLLTSDESTLTNNNYDENYYTANSSSVIYSWDAYDTDKIEKVKQDVLNKTITIKVHEVSNEIKQ